MSAGVIIAAVIGIIAMVWMWRSGAFQGLGQAGTNFFTIPGAAAPSVPPSGGANVLPPIQSCNCTTNVSCNAFCNNVTSFNQCCFGSAGTLPPGEVEAPEPNPSLCSSQFNGKCNTECSSSTEEECIECNGVCDSDVPYTGTQPLEEDDVTAGAAQPTCPAGYVYNAAQNLCILATAGAAQPTCPPGYTYNVTYNLCVQTTAAPAAQTPIPPVLTTANPTRCKNVFNGSCNTECSSGTQSECNDCMIACGQATGGTASSGGTSGGRTPECSSRYNGSCNTECSGGSNSTCNACRAACGLAANIARVRTASQARHLLQNRLYNSLRAQSRPNYARRVGYDRQSRAVGNIVKVGNLF